MSLDICGRIGCDVGAALVIGFATEGLVLLPVSLNGIE